MQVRDADASPAKPSGPDGSVLTYLLIVASRVAIPLLAGPATDLAAGRTASVHTCHESGVHCGMASASAHLFTGHRQWSSAMATPPRAWRQERSKAKPQSRSRGRAVPRGGAAWRGGVPVPLASPSRGPLGSVAHLGRAGVPAASPGCVVPWTVGGAWVALRTATGHRAAASGCELRNCSERAGLRLSPSCFVL